MNRAKINELYEQAYVVYEVPYESSVVDPTIVSIYKHKVWDRYLFAELIVRACISEIQTVKDRKSGFAEPDYAAGFDDGMFVAIRTIKDHFED
jgi:hypothetical protein